MAATPHDLDDVIATGDGTTQPEGIINHALVTTVVWGGATSIGGYEAMHFGVPKQEHRPEKMSSAVFVGNETSYIRARALPVGATDARGEEVTDRPVYPNDLIGGFYELLGIDHDAKLPNPEGLDIRVTPTAADGVKTGGRLKEII